MGKNAKHMKEYMKKLTSILSAAKYLLGITFFSSVQKTQSYFQFKSEQASSFNNDTKTWKSEYYGQVSVAGF